MFGEKDWVVTLLTVSPEVWAIAFTVRFEATRKGAWYCCDDVLGTVPSVVK